jgi:hypothetical protein
MVCNEKKMDFPASVFKKNSYIWLRLALKMKSLSSGYGLKFVGVLSVYILKTSLHNSVLILIFVCSF